MRERYQPQAHHIDGRGKEGRNKSAFEARLGQNQTRPKQPNKKNWLPLIFRCKNSQEPLRCSALLLVHAVVSLPTWVYAEDFPALPPPGLPTPAGSSSCPVVSLTLWGDTAGGRAGRHNTASTWISCWRWGSPVASTCRRTVSGFLLPSGYVPGQSQSQRASYVVPLRLLRKSFRCLLRLVPFSQMASVLARLAPLSWRRFSLSGRSLCFTRVVPLLVIDHPGSSCSL